MTASQTLLDQISTLASERSNQRSEPAWLQQLRAQAQQRFAARGLPGKRLESWHYTAGDLWLRQFSERHTLAPLAPDASLVSPVALLAGHQLQFNHGYLVGEKIDAADRERLSVQPLAQLDTKEQSQLIDWLQARTPTDSLADLATALAPEPWVLIVREKLSRPIVLSHLATAAGSQISQLIVWLQPGAQATLIESFAASAEDYLHIANTSLRLERGARLTYVRPQREAVVAQHLGVVDADIGRDAQLKLQTLLGGEPIASERSRIRNGFYVDLNEPGAEFIARAAFAADEQQHIDYHFTVNHRANHGRSDVLVHGLAADKSRGIVNGRIFIAANTRGNDGHFTSHSLLLSATAEINSKPELEIYADDVRCAHGATIGQLDEAQILYLQTRGIDRDAAVALLKEGFLKAGLLDCGNRMLDRFLQHELLARIGLDVEEGELA